MDLARFLGIIQPGNSAFGSLAAYVKTVMQNLELLQLSGPDEVVKWETYSLAVTKKHTTEHGRK